MCLCLLAPLQAPARKLPRRCCGRCSRRTRRAAPLSLQRQPRCGGPAAPPQHPAPSAQGPAHSVLPVADVLGQRDQRRRLVGVKAVQLLDGLPDQVLRHLRGWWVVMAGGEWWWRGVFVLMAGCVSAGGGRGSGAGGRATRVQRAGGRGRSGPGGPQRAPLSLSPSPSPPRPPLATCRCPAAWGRWSCCWPGPWPQSCPAPRWSASRPGCRRSPGRPGRC
jgi:hypothetical protein